MEEKAKIREKKRFKGKKEREREKKKKTGTSTRAKREKDKVKTLAMIGCHVFCLSIFKTIWFICSQSGEYRAG